MYSELVRATGLWKECDTTGFGRSTGYHGPGAGRFAMFETNDLFWPVVQIDPQWKVDKILTRMQRTTKYRDVAFNNRTFYKLLLQTFVSSRVSGCQHQSGGRHVKSMRQ